MAGCKTAGILAHSAGLGVIDNNDVRGNAIAGIVVCDRANPQVLRNKVREGQGKGIVRGRARASMCTYACMYVCVCVCVCLLMYYMFVYAYIYVYVHTQTHTHTHTHTQGARGAGEGHRCVRQGPRVLRRQ
jgi:parallel beta-helix repeat protein